MDVGLSAAELAAEGTVSGFGAMGRYRDMISAVFAVAAGVVE